MTAKQTGLWVWVAAAVGVGWLITWVDSQPGWDDTGITAGAVFLAAAGLGLLRPRLAWLWALAVGVWIPLWGLLVTHNAGALLALAVAFAGALAGAAARLAFDFVSASRPPA